MKDETITVTITLPNHLVDKVEVKARKELRSRSGQIASIINDYFEREEEHGNDTSNRRQKI